jgi:hypothetical protein
MLEMLITIIENASSLSVAPVPFGKYQVEAHTKSETSGKS